MTIGDRIKYLREKSGLTQTDIAEKLGIATQTIFKYEKNIVTNIPIGNIEKLANIFDVSPSYLMGWPSVNSSSVTPYNPKVHDILILGQIAAGLPLYAEDNIEGYTYTDRNGGAEYFALRVKGDSMTAAQINDGNLIIVRVQSIVENGEIAVVRVNNDEATVKRFKQEGDIVHLVPQSFNPKHEVQTYNLKDTKIEVVGKVVECRVEF
ncbi:MAG: helix-turn-helix domain-containing protein [Clostridia bacterium]|nr:helix-turn-helix domain-containing protein [Clostridia bacterium]